MSVRLTAVLALSTAAASCGGGSSVDSANPASLAYSLPAMREATYMVVDSVTVLISAMGQNLAMRQSSETIFDASFEQAGRGVTVSLATRAFNGAMSPPMGSPVSGDESGVAGDLVFTLDSRGNVTPVSGPELSGGAAQIFPALTTTYTLFPGLPGEAADPGMSWTDTIQFQGPEGGSYVDMFSVLEYTVLGDSVVDGRTLLKLDVLGTAELEIAATTGGIEALQSIFAGVAGHVLWDMTSGLMYERVTVMDGDGTVEAAVAPQPFPLTMTASSVVRLDGN